MQVAFPPFPGRRLADVRSRCLARKENATEGKEEPPSDSVGLLKRQLMAKTKQAEVDA